jgi:hypothetical protein
MSAETYRQLEAQVNSHLHVSDKTTELMAGEMIGVQKVLKALRDGFVVGA